MHANDRRRPRGVLGRRIVFALTLAGAVAVMTVFGCRDEFATDIDTNRPPDTYLTGFPAESTTTVYNVHLYWYGNDVDGVVTGYEYAITDSLPLADDTLAYHYTTRTDSIFRIQVSEQAQVLGHRFYIRAIDNEGQVDPEPAWTFFAAADLIAPSARFTRSEAWDPESGARMELTRDSDSAAPDTVPAGWNVGFHWAGVDTEEVVNELGEVERVGEVVGYRFSLFPGQEIISGGPGDTTAVYDQLESVRYTFSLFAVDDAGFAGLDPVTRVFIWNQDPNTFYERGFNPVTGDSLAHFYASSNAWEGEHEFFAGDTVPLIAQGFFPAPVTVRVVYGAEDPDDILGAGLSDFQYRTAAGLWRAVPNPESFEISLPGLYASDLILELRCQDGFGRKDGTPARMSIHVNRAPVLLDTLGFVGGEPVLPFPQRNQAISLDSLAAWGNVLHVRVMAADPDSTARRFFYQFRDGSFLYGDPVSPSEGEPAEYDLTIDEQWRQPGNYAIGVRIKENAYQANRQVDLAVPFSFCRDCP